MYVLFNVSLLFLMQEISNNKYIEIVDILLINVDYCFGGGMEGMQIS